ncbi:unnamed protein product [Rangifer tarandus platyrhynchus]|uniref:Uncharacterized protein n=2 Tax=Rangifer tarandus platyrhynchus TaxID=3082113 RepID=A0ABN8YC02_RANTA|nr:unnamed protein product [Rangifer tarandus platyrhynchus]CAI9698178.1 unnamed protein product [Rangifer tarandus platyrhynchus]
MSSDQASGLPCEKQKRGAESHLELGRCWKETGCSGLRPPSQVQPPGFERRRDVGGRTPTVAVGTGFKAWEKFLHFEKKGPLVGGYRGETEGLRPAPPPGGCSCFFHLCHQVSAAEPRRIRETRGADTRTHTGLQFRCLLGSPRISRPHRPNCRLSALRNTPGGPGRRTPPAWPFHTLSGRPASHSLLSLSRSSHPQLGLLDFLCRGRD